MDWTDRNIECDQIVNRFAGIDRVRFHACNRIDHGHRKLKRLPAANQELNVVSGHLQSGQIRGLVASSKSPPFPDVPVLTQLGYRQNVHGVWYAFFAPAGVSKEVTAALVPAIEKAVKDPGIVAKLAPLGMVQDYASPEKLVTEMREEYQSVEEIAKKAGLVK